MSQTYLSDSTAESVFQEIQTLLLLIEALRDDFQSRISLIRQEIIHTSDMEHAHALLQEVEQLYDTYTYSLRHIEGYIETL